jgi:hypothetical protein
MSDWNTCAPNDDSRQRLRDGPDLPESNPRTKMSKQETPAQGQRGILIRSIDDRFYFRQYTSDYDFVDYEITNHDMEIEIVDPDAALIRNQHGDFLDYTSESMNVVQKSDPEPTSD